MANKYDKIAVYVDRADYRKLKSYLALSGSSFSEWVRNTIRYANLEKTGVTITEIPASELAEVGVTIIDPIRLAENKAKEFIKLGAGIPRTYSLMKEAEEPPLEKVVSPKTSPKEKSKKHKPFRTEKFCPKGHAVIGGRCPECD